MPFYEYQCSHCRYYVEVMQKITDAPLKKCPSCGKRTLKKLMSAPVFRLKGSGWYETDFKSDQERKRNLAGADKEATAESGSAAAGAPGTAGAAGAAEAAKGGSGAAGGTAEAAKAAASAAGAGPKQAGPAGRSSAGAGAAGADAGAGSGARPSRARARTHTRTGAVPAATKSAAARKRSSSRKAGVRRGGR